MDQWENHLYVLDSQKIHLVNHTNKRLDVISLSNMYIYQVWFDWVKLGMLIGMDFNKIKFGVSGIELLLIIGNVTASMQVWGRIFGLNEWK